MNQAWYQVVSLLYGYVAAAVVIGIFLMTVKKLFGDAALLRRVKKSTPQVGAVGCLRVIGRGTRRMPDGTEICVPYEGTLGAAHHCDVCIPYRRVHMRSAFFWMEKDGLHMVALHKDGFFADDVPINPGDEAILGNGAVLRVRELRMELRLYPAAMARMNGEKVLPYVTSARRTCAQQGHGEGIGAPGKGEMRREKKINRKIDAEKKDGRRATDSRNKTRKSAEKR